MPENKENHLVPYGKAEDTKEHGLTFTFHSREMHMYNVTLEELQNLVTSGNYRALDIAMFSIFTTAFLTIFITLLTVEIDNIYTFSVFVCVCVISFFGALFTGIRIRIASKTAENNLNKITGK